MRSVLTCVKQLLALEMCFTLQAFMSYIAELDCHNFFEGLDTLLIHIDYLSKSIDIGHLFDTSM